MKFSSALIKGIPSQGQNEIPKIAEQSFIAQSGPLKVQVAMRVNARMSVRQVP